MDTVLVEEIDTTQEVIAKLEACMTALCDPERSIWTHTEIDPVVDNLLEIWQLFHPKF